MSYFFNTPEVSIDRLPDCQHYRQHKSMRNVPVGFVCQLHEMAAVWKTPWQRPQVMVVKRPEKTTASAVTLSACLIWSQGVLIMPHASHEGSRASGEDTAVRGDER